MANSLFNWFTSMLMAAIMHPFFVSVVELNHNTTEKTFEASIRIYVDDLETTLKANNKKNNIDLAKPTNKQEIDKLITNYINTKLQVKVNDAIIPMQYLGYEIKQESVWIYFEANNIATIKKVEVNCSLLHDFKKEQINIFHVKANGTEKSYKLDYPNTKAMFNY